MNLRRTLKSNKDFYKNWKSAEEVIRTKYHLNEHGVNYLLNVGPDALGRMPAPAIDILKSLVIAKK